MPFVLVRIDDRLIHGQVVVGWVHALQPERIILCNDEVANSGWERDLYLNAYPGSDLKIDVLTIKRTEEFSQSELFEREKIILLVESPKDAWKLLEAGVSIKEINVGGIHYKENAKEIASYVFVSDEDIYFFKKICEKGVKVEARDVPNARQIDIIKLLNKMS